jgi:hypothetical protein
VIGLRLMWLRCREWVLPPRQLMIISGDVVPAKLPSRDLVMLRENGEDWSVTMRCPCGCSRLVELPLLREARPRWTLSVDERNRPSLIPSIWLKGGCRSHFFVRSGKVVWV